MLISSWPSPVRVRSKSTSWTSTRGSQRSSAWRTSVSMRPTVAASIVSKTKSCTPQPNSGRIGRSPGAVLRISSIAWSMSCSPLASAMPPRRSTGFGKARPEPRSSVIARPTLSDQRGASTEVDHAAGDRDRRAAVDLDRVALQLQRALRLDLDLRRLDRHLHVRLELDRLRGLEAPLAVELARVGPRAALTGLDGLLHVAAVDLDDPL